VAKLDKVSKERRAPAGQDLAVRAAGGVVCRVQPSGAVEAAVIHRRASADWTLPKGKLYPGETPEQGALREVKEETGFRCQLLRSLGSIDYNDRRGRRKIAFYWLMKRLAGRFQPGEEVDHLLWLPFEAAAELLHNERDQVVLQRARVSGMVAGHWPSAEPARRLA
jgi:8-oxo-dGTP pyrophosphatase MutT (NUDIX family)